MVQVAMAWGTGDSQGWLECGSARGAGWLRNGGELGVVTVVHREEADCGASWWLGRQIAGVWMARENL